LPELRRHSLGDLTPSLVTATDTGVNPPITGSVSFIITIDPGLVVSASSGNGIYTAAPSTQVANVFTAVVAGGSGSYTYALSGAGSGSASGISVGPTGIVSLDGSKATNNGPLSVTLTVTDTADTSVTGTYTFTINIS